MMKDSRSKKITGAGRERKTASPDTRDAASSRGKNLALTEDFEFLENEFGMTLRDGKTEKLFDNPNDKVMGAIRRLEGSGVVAVRPSGGEAFVVARMSAAYRLNWVLPYRPGGLRKRDVMFNRDERSGLLRCLKILASHPSNDDGPAQLRFGRDGDNQRASVLLEELGILDIDWRRFEREELSRPQAERRLHVIPDREKAAELLRYLSYGDARISWEDCGYVARLAAALPGNGHWFNLLLKFGVPEEMFYEMNSVALGQKELALVFLTLASTGETDDLGTFAKILLKMTELSMNDGDVGLATEMQGKLNAILKPVGVKIENDKLVGAPLPSAPKFEGYDPQTRTIHFAGRNIVVSKKARTDAATLMEMIQEEPPSVINRGEFNERVGACDAEGRSTNKDQRIYNAAIKVNKAVEKSTGMGDFLIRSMMTARINDKYLNQANL